MIFYLFYLFTFLLSYFFCTFAAESNESVMKYYSTIVLAALMLTGCEQKKKTEDIIVPKQETVKAPQGPIRMQEYNQTKVINWLGRPYQVEICRIPDDSLRMVTDETGQKFVDNRISLKILRSDGSTFYKATFTKAAFDNCLDQDYRKTGILEGFVFDKVEGAQLFFAASVCHPQTDEYIPMVVTVSSQGEVGIKRDTEMDTYGNEEQQLPQQ